MDVELSGSVVNGRYGVEKKIQSGYFGTTWLAVDKLNNTQVCLKTFFRENSSQKKELSVLKELSNGHFRHDNLCAVLDICVEKAPITSWKGSILCSTQYVVFEYCSGSDLFNFLVTGPFEKLKRVSSFSEPLSRHYFTQALLAVMYLHEKGVFHRDIKPENCVLDHHFNLKLTDFGTNKIIPPPTEPGQMLRASTGGIGTDSYRAPEVTGKSDYDPSAADVWSLGVTLLFMVGIEEMVQKVQTLDQYVRSIMAPLGICFPFPFHCRLLDTAIKSQADISAILVKAGGPTVSRCFPNLQFWSEWSSLRDILSSDLLDFFNSIFVLSPAHRGVLRDLARHPWISSGQRLTPSDIVQHMKDRCPSGIVTSSNASPRVIASKLLGGVDQATLRQSLSSHSNLTAPTDYLSDAEVWLFSDQLRQLESLQMDIFVSDIQDIMIDICFSRQVLKDLLQDPGSERARSIPVSNVSANWISQLLACIGFLPQGRLFYLMKDRLNLELMNRALGILEGAELAVTRSVVSVNCYDMEQDEEEMVTEAIDGQLFIPSSCSIDSGHSTYHSSQPESASTSTSRLHSLRRTSSDPALVTSPTDDDISPMESLQPQSSQESTWTTYTNGDSLSAQSSQEELPEATMISSSGQDYANSHYFMQLDTLIDKHRPQQFRAAGEFCKMSGLLCSYGLYQVVVNEQLALFCRGNTACFSARVVASDETRGKIGISSWCFQGYEEWVTILLRLSNDMNSS